MIKVPPGRTVCFTSLSVKKVIRGFHLEESTASEHQAASVPAEQLKDAGKSDWAVKRTTYPHLSPKVLSLMKHMLMHAVGEEGGAAAPEEEHSCCQT